MKNFFDTNIILELGEKLFDEGEFYISSVTLEELENIKTRKTTTEELRYKARRAIHWLDENDDKYTVIVYDKRIEEIIDFHKLEITPDNKIIASCFFIKQKLREDFAFVTNDLCCKVVARDVFKLPVNSLNRQENIYKGYKLIRGNSEYITTALSSLEDWVVNEYAVIQNTDDGSEREMRFDGEKFVSLKLPPSKYIKGKNALQRCALDILNNPDITIAAILGGYGSGKSYVSFRMALYAVTEKGWQSKILGVREPLGEGREIGFLPGSMEEKTCNFFLPLAQQLDGGEFELEELKRRGVLESNIPYYMKGTTYNSTVILVDEAEDLTDKQIRLIGTRLGEESKIILDGDYKQAVINASDNNPLIRMCNEFKGNPMFGCIYLGEDVRSTASKMFSTLFD